MPVSSTTSRCKNPQTVLKNLSATVSFHHDTPNEHCSQAIHKNIPVQETILVAFLRARYPVTTSEGSIRI